jgi:hypothetical protein
MYHEGFVIVDATHFVCSVHPLSYPWNFVQRKLFSIGDVVIEFELLDGFVFFLDNIIELAVQLILQAVADIKLVLFNLAGLTCLDQEQSLIEQLDVHIHLVTKRNQLRIGKLLNIVLIKIVVIHFHLNLLHLFHVLVLHFALIEFLPFIKVFICYHLAILLLLFYELFLFIRFFA